MLLPALAMLVVAAACVRRGMGEGDGVRRILADELKYAEPVEARMLPMHSEPHSKHSLALPLPVHLAHSKPPSYLVGIGFSRQKGSAP